MDEGALADDKGKLYKGGERRWTMERFVLIMAWRGDKRKVGPELHVGEEFGKQDGQYERTSDVEKWGPHAGQSKTDGRSTRCRLPGPPDEGR